MFEEVSIVHLLVVIFCLDCTKHLPVDILCKYLSCTVVYTVHCLCQKTVLPFIFVISRPNVDQFFTVFSSIVPEEGNLQLNSIFSCNITFLIVSTSDE